LNSVSESPILEFASIDHKPIYAAFDGGNVSSDAGLLLLKEAEQNIGVVKALTSCIDDKRDQRYVDHSYQSMSAQRVFQIASGYEDANDCNSLRIDPILKICTGRLPDSHTSLASQPTMTRFENTPSRTELYKMAYAMVDQFQNSYDEEPRCIILDFDDTEDIVHGHQQLCLFNAYANEYCFMPLHIYEGFSGKHIGTLLKPGKRLSGAGALAILSRLVTYLRKRWSKTVIVFRGDSHFASPKIMQWIEQQKHLFFVTGLATNTILRKEADITVKSAQKLSAERNEKVTLFHTISYKAGTWHSAQRVIVKVEVSPEHDDPNVRYIVSNILHAKASVLYSEIYCARGNAELYIKDHKTYLKSDRTSCHRFAANQFRVFLHSAAYVLIHYLQHTILRTTEFEHSTMETIRLKLFKIGARVREYKTRIKIELPTSFPAHEIFYNAYRELQLWRC
jgi:Transposase DDE domain group 1